MQDSVDALHGVAWHGSIVECVDSNKGHNSLPCGGDHKYVRACEESQPLRQAHVFLFSFFEIHHCLTVTVFAVDSVDTRLYRQTNIHGLESSRSKA